MNVEWIEYRVTEAFPACATSLGRAGKLMCFLYATAISSAVRQTTITANKGAGALLV